MQLTHTYKSPFRITPKRRGCWGYRRKDQVKPNEDAIIDKYFTIPAAMCVKPYGEMTFEQVMGVMKEDGVEEIQAFGGLPNPVSMYLQGGAYRSARQRSIAFNEFTVGQFRQNVLDGLSTPLWYDYPGAVERAIRLAGWKRFVANLGVNFTPAPGMTTEEIIQAAAGRITIDKTRDMGRETNTPMMNWEVKYGHGKNYGHLDRTGWLDQWYDEEERIVINGYPSGPAAIVLASETIDGINFNMYVGDRGPATVGAPLMQEVWHSESEARKQYVLAHENQKGNTPLAESVELFIGSSKQIGDLAAKVLKPIHHENVEGVVLALSAQVQNGFLASVGTYQGFVGTDLWLRLRQAGEWMSMKDIIGQGMYESLKRPLPVDVEARAVTEERISRLSPWGTRDLSLS